MRFSRQLITARSAESVCDYLNDPLNFGMLFPDCKGIEIASASTFVVSIGVGNGQLRGTLDLNFAKSNSEISEIIRYIGRGQAAGNGFSFEVAFHIAANSGGSDITCDCLAEVSGPIMFLAPAMAEDLGRQKLDALVTNLQAVLTSPQ